MENDLLLKRYEREKLARKQAEKLLEAKGLELYEKNESLKKIALFSELDPSPILSFNSFGKVDMANPAASSALLREHLIGVNFEAIFPNVGLLDFYESLFTGKEIYHSISLGNRYFDFTFHFFKKHHMVHAYGRDITKRIEAEQRSQEKERAATMWQIAAGVGHEMGNALLAITGLKSRLKKLISKKATWETKEAEDKYNDFLERMASEINRAQGIASAMSGLSRKNQDKEFFSVGTLVRNIIEAIKWKEKNVQFQIVTIDEASKTYADIDTIRQIIINLLKNAMHAIKTQQEQKIVVVVEDVLDAIEISISDNGVGIPEENLPKIFDNFFTTKPQGEGTGIGLAECLSLSKENGGELIVLKTQIGVGTTFKLTLPKGKTQ